MVVEAEDAQTRYNRVLLKVTCGTHLLGALACELLSVVFPRILVHRRPSCRLPASFSEALSPSHCPAICSTHRTSSSCLVAPDYEVDDRRTYEGTCAKYPTRRRSSWPGTLVSA